jgi:hypothetical protein
LSQVKQELNETLRSYTQCLFEMQATIANITDEDVIRCFQNGLFSKHTYHDLLWKIVENCGRCFCLGAPEMIIRHEIY